MTLVRESLPAGAVFRWCERTRPQSGAVRVLALSGDWAQALDVLAGRRPPRPGSLALARLRGGGQWLDEALLVALPEGQLELHLHGGSAVLAAVEACLGALGGVRSALPPPAPFGMDRGLERRARERLLAAESRLETRALLLAAQGQLRLELERALLLIPAAWGAFARDLLARSKAAWPLWRAPKIVLIGPANAGKSTLFNVLLGRDAALVSPLAGTTRDVLAERGRLEGLLVEWLDTAGQRELPDAPREPEGAAKAALEQAGQRRGRAAAGDADLVLLLAPWGTPWPQPGDPLRPLLRVRTHAPALELEPGCLTIDALERPAEARQRVLAAVAQALDIAGLQAALERPILFDSRDQQALERILDCPNSAARRAALAQLLA